MRRRVLDADLQANPAGIRAPWRQFAACTAMEIIGASGVAFVDAHRRFVGVWLLAPKKSTARSIIVRRTSNERIAKFACEFGVRNF